MLSRQSVNHNWGMFGLMLLAMTFPIRLHAALGGDASSVQADQVHLQATLRTTRAAAYTVQEIHSTSGIVVREYLSPRGLVFAVAWQGPWPPDMHQLLGDYFGPYQRAMAAPSGGRRARRPVQVDTPELVIHLAGHPRSFTGQAYVPGMLPVGVAAEEIR